MRITMIKEARISSEEARKYMKELVLKYMKTAKERKNRIEKECPEIVQPLILKCRPNTLRCRTKFAAILDDLAWFPDTKI